MNICTALVAFLIPISVPCLSQSNDKIEIKAIDRQIIRRKDTVYRFYATLPDRPVRTRPDRTYYWCKSDTILTTEGGYDGKLLDGPYTEFYPDKNLAEEGRFKEGLRIGEWKTWYPGGKIHSIIHWDAGLKSGSFVEFDPAGRMSREGYFKKGRLSGKLKEYTPDGKYSVVKFEDGQPIQPKKKLSADSLPDKPRPPGAKPDKEKNKKP